MWEKHWRCLNADALKVGVDLAAFERDSIEKSLHEVIDENSVSNGRCRVSLFDETMSKIWGNDSDKQTSVLIQTADARKIKQNISVTVSPIRINSTSPLAGVKSCNYLENLLAFENAQSGGFDEAIRLNQKGEITSASLANVFWLKDEKLFTPSLKTGCRAGTTREFILEEREVYEVLESIESIKNADAVFLTSSGIGVLQLANIDEIAFDRELNKLTRITNTETRP